MIDKRWALPTALLLFITLILSACAPGGAEHRAKLLGEAGTSVTVTVRHADGYETLYAHCSKITVSSGQSVLRGDTLGAVGATGNATGAHLHFEVHDGEKYLNPVYYVVF